MKNTWYILQIKFTIIPTVDKKLVDETFGK